MPTIRATPQRMPEPERWSQFLLVNCGMPQSSEGQRKPRPRDSKGPSHFVSGVGQCASEPA
eukprot:11228264-Lingulodinium_polyedra.AAC.1